MFSFFFFRRSISRMKASSSASAAPPSVESSPQPPAAMPSSDRLSASLTVSGVSCSGRDMETGMPGRGGSKCSCKAFAESSLPMREPFRTHPVAVVDERRAVDTPRVGFAQHDIHAFGSEQGDELRAVFRPAAGRPSPSLWSCRRVFRTLICSLLAAHHLPNASYP